MFIHTQIDILWIFCKIIHTGIIQLHFAIFFNGASGKTSTPVICFAWKQCNPLFFPVHQIFADNMSPVHPSPARRIRETLVKKMIHTFVIYKAIRVIHPVVFRFYIYFLHILLTFYFSMNGLITSIAFSASVPSA